MDLLNEYGSMLHEPEPHVDMRVTFIYAGSTYDWKFAGSDGSKVSVTQNDRRTNTFYANFYIDTCCYQRTIFTNRKEISQYLSKAMFLQNEIERIYNYYIRSEHRARLERAATINESKALEKRPSFFQKLKSFIMSPFNKEEKRRAITRRENLLRLGEIYRQRNGRT